MAFKIMNIIYKPKWYKFSLLKSRLTYVFDLVYFNNVFIFIYL